MPSHLGCFFLAFGDLYGDVDEFIHKHTEFNFYCCGLPKSRFSAQRARLISPHRGPVRLCRLPLLLGTCDNTYLECPECIAAQKKEHGFSYIDRLAGALHISICPSHGIPMRVASGQMQLFHQECQLPASRHQIEIAMELGNRIKTCMENTVDESRYHMLDVIAALKESNWIDENGRVRASDLIQTFPKFFKGKFPEARLQSLVGNEAQLQITLTALMNPGKAIPPTMCVLLRWFAEEVLNATAPRPPSIDIKRRPQRPVPLKETIVKTLAEHRTLKATAKALNIQQAVLSVFCDANDIAVDAKNRKHRTERNDIIIDCAAGMSARALAEKYNVSISCAYRWRTAFFDNASQQKQKKAQKVADDLTIWNQVREENPSLSTVELRRLLPKEYARLQRNDKALFQANKPSVAKPKAPTGCHRASELTELATASIEELLQRNALPNDRPQRLSKYNIAEKIGLSSYALKTCEDESLVPNVKESKEEFATKRIILEAQARSLRHKAFLDDAEKMMSHHHLVKNFNIEEAKKRFANAPEGYAKQVGIRSGSLLRALKHLERKD